MASSSNSGGNGGGGGDYQPVPLTTAAAATTTKTHSCDDDTDSAFLAVRCVRCWTKPLRDLYRFFAELCAEFGWRFVAIVALVYGFNQGFGEGYLSQVK